MNDKYETLRAVYHDKVYAQNNVLDGQFRGPCRMYQRLYGHFMPQNKAARIIDIGCGPGQFLKFCLNNGYANVQGIDLSPGQVAYAIENVTHHVRLGDGLEWLDAHPNSYDLVVANDFIEHLARDKGIEFVGLAKKALVPGGLILMKTGNMAAFGGIVIWCGGLDHECGYTERSLKYLLEMWDFRDVEALPYYAADGLKRLPHTIAHTVLGLLYRHIYQGNYPRIYTKLIAIKGVA